MQNPIILDLTGIDRYSFSKLSSFHTCQLQYDYNYNKKIPGESNSFADYGTSSHEILEKFFNGNLATFELTTEYEKVFEEIRDNGGVSMLVGGKNGYSTIDLTESYYNSGLEYFDTFDGFPDLELISTEKRFDLLLEHKGKKFILNGFIDLVAKKDGDLIIIDHKSKSKFKSTQEKKEYSRQLALYSLYASHKYGQPVKEVWFNQFRIGTITKFELTDDLIEEALDWAVDTIEQIEQENWWLPNTISNFFCNNLCNFRYICPYSKLYEQEGETA